MRSILDSITHTHNRASFLSSMFFQDLTQKRTHSNITSRPFQRERSHFPGKGISEYFMLSSDITNLEWGEDLCLPDPSSISLSQGFLNYHQRRNETWNFQHDGPSGHFIAELWHSTFNVFLWRVKYLETLISWTFGRFSKRKTVLNKQQDWYKKS